MPEGQQPRRVTPRPRSGAAAESARLRGRRNGREDPPCAQGQGRQLGGAIPCPRSSGYAGTGGPRGAIPRWRSGGVVVRRYLSSKEGAAAVLCWSSREEIPNAQGKRNPSKMVGIARGHQRADTLKPYSQKTSQSNHTRTTALSNSMKLSHVHGATQDRWVMVERSDRMWSTGEGNGKPL